MFLQGIGWAVGWFLAYLVAHVILMRIIRPRVYFASAFRLWLALLVLFLLMVGVIGCLRGVALLNSVLLLGSFWAYYMIVTYNLARSVSIRTVTELVRSPARAVTAEDLEQLYDTDAMFDRRIDSMVANGYLAQRGERFALTAKGRAMARAAMLVRRILNVQTYG